MILTQIYLEFGYGNLAVGCGQLEDGACFVKITQTFAPQEIGTDVARKDVVDNSEIFMRFPTEEQTISVMSAFTNKTYQQILDKWNAKKEAKRWVVTISSVDTETDNV